MKKRGKEQNNRSQSNKIKFGIVQKLLIGTLLPLVVGLAITGSFLGVKVYNDVSDVMGKELTAEANSAANQVDAFFQKYYGIAECLASTQLVRNTTSQSLEGGTRADPLYGSLLDTLQTVQQLNRDDVIMVWIGNYQTGELVQSDGSVKAIDLTSRDWYAPVMQKKQTVLTALYEDINTKQNLVSIVTPVFLNNEIISVVGLDLDMAYVQSMLGNIKVGKNGYITLYDSSDCIVYHPDSNVIYTQVKDANYSDNIRGAIENRESVEAVHYTRNNFSYCGSTVPLDDLDYLVLGLIPEQEFIAQTRGILYILVIGIILCGVILAAIITFMALSITRPLKRLNNVAGKLAEGELDVQVDITGSDEVGALARNTASIVQRLKKYIDYIDEVTQVLYQIGKGNLVFTLRHDYVGEFAKIKRALLDVQSTLTQTLSSIAQSADQVNIGAEQIASSAQALAQGATEQASSVQELSATVQDLSEQVSQEAKHAVEAGQYLERVNEEVGKSNEQMKNMREAMEQISNHSNAIGKIIKTIDDIAFQTNILALNAAVEAARAGEAGKGFAVVADEVRTLAGKSADAAKETNELIANSVAAVKHGEEIANCTAESLASVAEESKRVVESIENIAKSYQDQAHKLSEIVVGVDQISNVVQTNSATSEQSAAASEELSGQAAAMRNQVSHFKMNDEMLIEMEKATDTESSNNKKPAQSDSHPSNPFANKY